MFFNSLEDLWLMSGHGAFVWSCYGLFVGLLALNVWHSRSQRAKALKQVRAIARRVK
jgi:heme exporter protein D